MKIDIKNLGGYPLADTTLKNKAKMANHKKMIGTYH